MTKLLIILILFSRIFLVGQTEKLENENIIKFTNEQIKKNPNDFFLYKTRADAKLSLGKYKDAIEDYNYSIKLNGNNSEAFLNRGSAFFYSKKNNLAEKDFVTAIKLNKMEINAYVYLGILKQNNLNYIEAINFYSKALTINYNEDAMYNRGLCNKYIEKYPESIDDFSNVLRHNSKHINSFLSRGAVYLLQKKYTLVMTDLEMAKGIDMKNPEVYKRMALLQIEEKQYLKACENLRIADSLGGVNIKELIKKNCK